MVCIDYDKSSWDLDMAGLSDEQVKQARLAWKKFEIDYEQHDWGGPRRLPRFRRSLHVEPVSVKATEHEEDPETGEITAEMVWAFVWGQDDRGRTVFSYSQATHDEIGRPCVFLRGIGLSNILVDYEA